MLLKVASIIMMVGGIIGAVVSVIMAIVVGLGAAVLSTDEGKAAIAESNVDGSTATVVMGLIVVATIILVIGSVLEIIAGVKGKKNWNNPAAAQSLMIFGIVVAAVTLIGNILFASGGAGTQVVSILTGLVVPVLYIIGAVQLKKQG